MNKILTIIAIILLIYNSELFAQESTKIDFYFFAAKGYKAKNNNYILKSNDTWKDDYSSFGGEITFRDGEFAKNQYELSLRYISSFSDPASTLSLLRQLYIQTPLSDYLFLTVGKREKKYGSAIFHNFSNRLSPEERLLGRLEQLPRQAPGLIQLDWVTSQYVSLGIFSWSVGAEKWKNNNIGAQIELELNNNYAGLYVYYEKLKNLYIGINLSRQFGLFRLYSEGIIKEKSEQYFSEVLKFKNRNKIHFSFSNGIAWEWKYYSTNIEYAFRSEGFNNTEKTMVENYIRSSDNAISYYNRDYFGRNYFGINFGTSRLFITNLSLNLSNLNLGDLSGGELEMGLSYLHKEAIIFGFHFLHYYGENDSEYVLFIPHQSQLSGFITAYF